MSRISEIAKEMKTWWGNDGSDIEVQNALDEIIRLDEATDRKTKPQTEISYQDCANALLKMWMDNILTDGEFNRIIDKLNEDRDKIKCPKCGRSDYIRSFKDWGIDGGIYKYKCINCNTYIKGADDEQCKDMVRSILRPLRWFGWVLF